MAVRVNLPDQGVTSDQWRNIFLTSDDRPKNFRNDSTPNKVASDFVDSLLIIATIAAVVYLILSAWTLVTSGGDEAKYTKAKTGVINAIIGIVVLMLLYGFISIFTKLAGAGAV